MYCFSRVSLLLLFAASLVNADDNIFVFPDQNSTVTPAWVLGDTKEVKWNTTYDLVDFGFSAADSGTVVWVVGLSLSSLTTSSILLLPTTYCYQLPATPPLLPCPHLLSTIHLLTYTLPLSIENIKKPQASYNWTLNTNNSASPTSTQVFFLALRHSTNSSNFFVSQAVEITPQPLSQSDVPLKATATFTRIEFINVTQTSTVVPATDASTATGAAGLPADTTSSSLSAGAKAGIGGRGGHPVRQRAAEGGVTPRPRRRRPPRRPPPPPPAALPARAAAPPPSSPACTASRGIGKSYGPGARVL